MFTTVVLQQDHGAVATSCFCVPAAANIVIDEWITNLLNSTAKATNSTAKLEFYYKQAKFNCKTNELYCKQDEVNCKVDKFNFKNL